MNSRGIIRRSRLPVVINLLGIAAVAAGICAGCAWFARDVDVAAPRVSKRRVAIMGQGRASTRQMAALLSSKNQRIAYDTARKFAAIYVAEAQAEGVNADVAFVQMCLETDFLRFGGQVKPHQNNYCGLGATDDGAAGATFPTVRAGVRAHIQHLKAYASRQSLRHEIIDPRFNLVKRGSAPYIDQLAGAWATDPRYAEKLARLLARLKQA